TVCATVARCHEDAARPPPIGRPLRGVEVLVLDGRLEPVPAGTAGDLYIGGVGLARGYLGQAGLTAERFIPHPHPREPGARLYRTGDRARFDADGALEFLGREDRQVKVRGHRVELEEIEAILERHPAVREAAVVAREVAGEVHLVAYAGLEPGGNEADLRSSLKATLPRFMLPSALVVLDALPRTLHGKVDHRRLPAVERRRPADLPQPQAPRTALERELVRLWESLLGVAPVGVTDDFFDLGGHSLLATRMMAQLQAAHGRRLSTLTLLQGPTIQALARALESPAAVARSPVVPLRARGSGLPFFCVHPVGGSVACYVELARSLGPDHPFLGLQSPGLDGTPYPFTSLEEIAADYLEAIRRRQPSGPYALGGWSNGGVLAFEMAQQLVQRGEQVALLALIDSRAPTPETRKSLMGMLGELDDAAMGYLFLLHLARLSQQRPTARLDALRRLPPAQLHAHLAEEANRFGALPPGATAEMLQPILHVYRTNFRSVIQYHPRPYAGALTLFRASEEVPEPPHPPPWGWETYAAGPFEVHDVGGNHYTAVSKTHSPALAQQLRRSLERAVERRP
ncbi:MAG TPA: thioesterase domain-containing protein, partial [Myxococcales bacterium]|nr:thioesterase domain-containing protein [Myxococcales bacterium]